MLLRTCCLSFLLLVTAFNANPLFAQQADNAVVLSDDVREDSYLAGGTVQSRANVTGDLIAFGGLVEIENEVSADVVAAGGTVSMRARVGDDVRLAGGDVSISGPVRGDALAAGGTVVLASSARVGGRAWLVGSTVEVFGNVGHELRAAGRRIVLAGNVVGDATLIADTIEIRPGAVISGNLRYRSPHQAQIGEGARIVGTVTRLDAPQDAQRKSTAAFAGMAWLGFLTSFMLAAFVYALLFPVASLGGARAIGESPWKSLGLGFALLVATPIAIALLFLTLIGAWLGIAAFLLFPVLLLAGFLTGVIWLGDVGLGWTGRRRNTTKGWHMLSIATALLALWIVALIPIVGCVALFAVLLFGIGGLMLYLARLYTRAG